MPQRYQRFQRSRKKGERVPEGCVYVGRGRGRYGQWGNPFKWTEYFAYDDKSKKAMACDDFRDAFYEVVEVVMAPKQAAAMAWIRENIHELAGKNVCCWCGLDEACHGDVLIEAANKET